VGRYVHLCDANNMNVTMLINNDSAFIPGIKRMSLQLIYPDTVFGRPYVEVKGDYIHIRIRADGVWANVPHVNKLVSVTPLGCGCLSHESFYRILWWSS
jgi:hypothetical protein